MQVGDERHSASLDWAQRDLLPASVSLAHSARQTRGIALVRRLNSRLAEGLVTHIERSNVDLATLGPASARRFLDHLA